MHRVSVISILLLASIFSTGIAHAQLSRGGTPPSLDPALAKGLSTEVPLVVLPGVDAAWLLAEDEAARASGRPGPLRFGVAVEADLAPDTSGIWETLPSGERLWRLRVSSPGAHQLGLIFDRFELSRGARLFITDATGRQVLGAFTEDNNGNDGLAIELVRGSEARIELVLPVLARAELHLGAVNHTYRDAFAATKDFGDSDACEVNVACPETAGWEDPIDSVVRLLVAHSSGFSWCSGSVVNNTAEDLTPYLLTAYHCQDGVSPVYNAWIAYFNYQSPTCANPGTEPSSNTLSGVVERAKEYETDMLLLELVNPIPTAYGAYYAGWDNGGLVPSSSVGIHHPAGDIKKFSRDDDAAVSTSWYGNIADTHWEVRWNLGVTEGGSSGSPLFDQDQRTVGWLSGGTSFCSTPTNPDLYGKVAAAWDGAAASSRLRDWLDPDSTGATTLDGTRFGGNGFDAAVEILSPAGSFVCSDTISPTVQLSNLGAETLTSVDLDAQIAGGSSTSSTWTGSLTSLTSTTVNLASMAVSPGSRTLTVTSSNPNGTTDGIPGNDADSETFRVLPIQAPPVVADFEDQVVPPANWQLHFSSGTPNTVSWASTTTASGFGVGTAAAFVDNYNADNRGNPDFLVLPAVDLRNLTSPATLTFDVAYARYNEISSDRLAIVVSPDCPGSSTIVFDKAGTTLATAPDTTVLFVPTSSQWRTETVNLDAYLGTRVFISFVNDGGWGNALYVDNITVTAGPPVPVELMRFEID